MLQTIERLAEVSVARGCGFAALGIFTMMVGLSPDPAMAFQAGGLLSLLTCAVLILKARNAPARPYRSTELWIILPKDQRPSKATAQQLIGSVLQAVYYRFAWHAALTAGMLLLVALLVGLVGIKGKPW